jgi:DNA-binding transcriptional LysR family regulator
MQTGEEKGIPQGEHALCVEARALSDWDATRIFLAVAREGSFQSAARHLKLHVNFVRRRVSKLERGLGVTLFTRHANGARVTPEAEKLLIAAQRMEGAAYDLLRARDQVSHELSGEVRLATTEGLGSYWIAPRLIEFQRAHPKLMIDLNCAIKSPNALQLETDVTVQITRPTLPSLRLVKLGRLHFMFFAAKCYLDTYGTPEKVSDLVDHRILIQADDNVQWRHLYDKLFPGKSPSGLVALRTNISSTHFRSISLGGGIGILPTYAYILGAPIVPLDLGIHETADIWLTYHPDVKEIPRVRRLIDWLIQSFAPQKYPWFRDEFVHPNEFAKAYHGEPLFNMFANFPAYLASR